MSKTALNGICGAILKLGFFSETESVPSEDGFSGASETSSETESLQGSNPRSNRLSAEMKYYEQAQAAAKHHPQQTHHKSHTKEKDRHSLHATSKG